MSQELYCTVFKIPAGWMGLLASHAGLKRVLFPQPSEQVAINLLGVDLDKVMQTPEKFQDLVKRFRAYFSGHRVEFPDKLDLSGATPFQRRVWLTTQKILHGETRSYGWVAGQVDQPGAARAVGQALGRNPLPIIVPCHRVVSGSGGLGGFTGGLHMKKYLLDLEKTGNKQASL